MNGSADYIIRNEGTLVIFTPCTIEAEQWWSENVADGPTICGAFVVEHRYARPIAEGLNDAGFNLVAA